MKKNELENCPQWLLESKTENEDVEIVNGKVIWKGGIWKGGTWEGEVWKYGIWMGGTWMNGTWEGGTWIGEDSAIKSKHNCIHNNGENKNRA